MPFNENTGSTAITALAFAGLCMGCFDARASRPHPLIVPQPQEIRWSDQAPIVLEEGQVCIVLGDQAPAPERYAAETLSRNVKKRYGLSWPVVSNKDVGQEKIRILLGRRTTNPEIDRLCDMVGIDLSDTSPGFDGYVIDILTDGYPEWKQAHVVVGGSNARGVIYGQDTLFQMLQSRGEHLELHSASIRDRPSVPWRGRPQTHYNHYLRPGELDAYMQSRINWIDLRNGIYAFEPGDELDKEGISRVIEEAHVRDLVVYGVVNCGVPAEEYPDALATFGEFIELGADGLWLSFDDKGPGEEPERIVRDVLALGREHGIRDHLIAICPPKGSYQDIETDFNRRIAAIPGMEKAHWFWTRWPAERYLEEARAIGLETKPGWWHNWPRLYTRRLYMQPIPLSLGWHAPPYENLTRGHEHTDVIMPWGGNAWGPHVVIPSIGWWGWTPARHDWEATRERIYRIVYGQGQIQTSRMFDDTLIETRRSMRYSGDSGKWQPPCPVRLLNEDDRAAVLDRIGQMKRLQDKVAADSPSETMLEAEQLRSMYLDRMVAELRMLEAGATLPFPEYWWEPHQRAVLTAVYDGDLDRADALIRSVQDRLAREIAEVAEAPEELGDVKVYVNWWSARAELDARGWQDLIAERREDYRALVKEYAWYVAVPGKMLAPVKDPPLDWGSGRWVIGNQVLARVLPTEREFAWGCWYGGLYREGDVEGAIFLTRRGNHSRPGEFSELEVVLPVAGAKRDRLALLMFVNAENKDNFGLQHTVGRWAGYRFAELLREDQLLWEADLGVPRENGEWSMVDLPKIPEGMDELKLRLRVIDRRVLTGNHTIATIGPIWLFERQEEYWPSRRDTDQDH